MFYKKILSIFTATAICIGLIGIYGVVNITSFAEDSNRQIISINSDWKFSKLSEKNDEYENSYDDSSWEKVSLPHTYNSSDGCDGWSKVYSDGSPYYRGIGAYRKVLKVDKENLNKRKFLEFEGVNTIADVYVNGEYVGTHEGGYSTFRFDVTDNLHTGDNIITVYADNSMTDYVAPIEWEGDFTKFGGIYRNVNLIYTDDVHLGLMDYGSDGVFVTSEISDNYSKGTVSIKAQAVNDSDKSQQAEISSVLYNAEGTKVLSVKKEVNLAAGESKYVILNGKISDPHLWNGTEDPYLYSVKTTISTSDYCDSVVVNTGFKNVSVYMDYGLYLNGKHLQINGVNYHQDSYENGWAMTSDQYDRDYDIMQNMGVNAVRMAHYQHNQYEYDICDERGIAVWAEIPLVNRTVSTENGEKEPTDEFCKNIKQQLTELLYQTYNNTSVMFIGISNELYDYDKKTISLYNELCEMAHDGSGRFVVYADNQGSNVINNRSAATDLVGYNRYEGWYYSSLGDMSSWITGKMKLNVKPTAVSEYGAGAAISQHMELPTMTTKIGHPEEYQAIFHEKTYADLETLEALWGKFVWCMFDFASDAREEGDTKGQNDKGLVTRDRQTYKDAYYFYKSVWNDENMLHLTSKRYYNHPWRVKQIKAYSNADSVELFVNGESMGVIKRSSLSEKYSTVFKWNKIEINEGKDNNIKLLAKYADGTTETEETTWYGDKAEEWGDYTGEEKDDGIGNPSKHIEYEKDVLKLKLEDALSKAEAIDISKYTKDSAAALTSAIKAAHALTDGTTADEISSAVTAIENAVSGLKLIGTVTGTIYVSDEEAKTKMTVTAEASDGAKITVTATSMGRYAIENLEPGDYTLTVSGGKYAERSYEVEVDGCVTQDVSLNLYGDVNGDGKMTTVDVGLTNSHAKGVKALTDYQFACADISRDGKVTTADVGQINAYAKGIKTYNT